MRSGGTKILVGWLVATCLASLAPARATEPSVVPEAASGSASERSARLLLDAIRDDLVGLRFEEALAAIEALLGEPELNEAEQGEALVLRSQAHVAFGDLDAAEQDYREILRARPGFVPDASLTPRKAVERFRRARATLIGDLVVEVQPGDAHVFVDDRAVALSPESSIPLVAGEHVLRAERDGFDSLRQTVRIEPNQDGRLELRLVPNARSVVLLTEPDGVDVALDGVWIGRTERPPDGAAWGAAQRPGRLTVENLSLGEHVFELSKPCFRSESVRDLLTVDLLDWSPKHYPLVSLGPVRSTVVLRGGPEGAEVRIDDEFMSRLPAAPIEVCPGERRLEVRQGSRRLWNHVARLTEAEEAVIEVRPRPNAVFVGAEVRSPEVDRLADRCNTTFAPTAAGGADLSTLEAWERLGLPGDIDLAVAPRPAGDAGAWWLYSPILGRVVPLDALPASLERPRWTGVAWGLSLVDSTRSGPALVAHVATDGAAFRAGLRPGDRLVSLGGSQVSDAEGAGRVLGVASAASPLDVEWLSPDGTARRGRMTGTPTLRLEVASPNPAAGAARAAWAVVDAASADEHRTAALANLALLLSTHGRYQLAVRAWRRVELPEGTGISRGTVQYYLGRDLERLGDEREAIRAHRAAAASDATTIDDEGPRVAPAARDRLADLGAE